MRRKASVTIEAALIIPIVFYTFMALFGFITYIHTDYQIGKASTEAAKYLSYDGYAFYHLQLSDLIAHHSYQKQNLTAPKLTEYAKDYQSMISFSGEKEGQAQKGYQEMIDLTKQLLDDISQIPENGAKIAKSEATVFLSRLFFDQYIKGKINSYFKRNPKFNSNRLSLLSGNYMYDFKASRFYVSYLYDFPLKLPFLKEVEIIQPIYVESYVGNIWRYQGEDYKEEEEEKHEEEAQTVYVIEKRKVYHTNPKCFTIYAEPAQYEKDSLTNAKPCKICQKKGKHFGAFVYKTKSSKNYHADKMCSAIHHQVMEISLQEAQEKGMVECKHCQKQK